MLKFQLIFGHIQAVLVVMRVNDEVDYHFGTNQKGKIDYHFGTEGTSVKRTDQFTLASFTLGNLSRENRFLFIPSRDIIARASFLSVHVNLIHIAITGSFTLPLLAHSHCHYWLIHLGSQIFSKKKHVANTVNPSAVPAFIRSSSTSGDHLHLRRLNSDSGKSATAAALCFGLFFTPATLPPPCYLPAELHLTPLLLEPSHSPPPPVDAE
ncbi:hypothetical protein LXL04_022941 [Taraxacum kok-saghyz]